MTLRLYKISLAASIISRYVTCHLMQLSVVVVVVVVVDNVVEPPVATTTPQRPVFQNTKSSCKVKSLHVYLEFLVSDQLS